MGNYLHEKKNSNPPRVASTVTIAPLVQPKSPRQSLADGLFVQTRFKDRRSLHAVYDRRHDGFALFAVFVIRTVVFILRVGYHFSKAFGPRGL